ncbi:fructose-bisphosphate aldolase class I [Lentimicrobium sp.]
MDTQKLINTAQSLMANSKGLLAMDESNPTLNKRFAAAGIPQTEEYRRAYREMIVTTPRLSESISGVILYDETIHQQLTDGTPFIKAALNAGLIPGIKVDEGTRNLALHPGEKVTQGLDGLPERLNHYAKMELRFAKWRAVITIGEKIPTAACIQANAHSLARYAALCQQVGMVPIIEPEVLMDGSHSIQQCYDVTFRVLLTVFEQLYTQDVLPEGIILKPNMVVPGLNSPTQATAEEVANLTVKCLLRAVPAAVPGIAFLSGGQSARLASARLSAMNKQFHDSIPWALSFSFARAIQQPAIDIWQGKSGHVPEAQQALLHRADCNRAACKGQYTEAMERN